MKPKKCVQFSSAYNLHLYTHTSHIHHLCSLSYTGAQIIQSTEEAKNALQTKTIYKRVFFFCPLLGISKTETTFERAVCVCVCTLKQRIYARYLNLNTFKLTFEFKCAVHSIFCENRTESTNQQQLFFGRHFYFFLYFFLWRKKKQLRWFFRFNFIYTFDFVWPGSDPWTKRKKKKLRQQILLSTNPQ